MDVDLQTLFPPAKEPEIIFEDEWYIAACKPSSMHTADVADGSADTLSAWMINKHPELASSADGAMPENGLLHRLDADTSGIVLFARTIASYNAAVELMASGDIVKTYQALASRSQDSVPGAKPPRFPSPKGNAFAVESFFRSYGEGGKRVAPVGLGEKSLKAVTKRFYRTEALVLKRDIPPDGGVLVQAVIRNGFRHQIRVHLAWAGFPIDGDTLYGCRDAPRLMLHAASLSFVHPFTKKRCLILSRPYDDRDQG